MTQYIVPEAEAFKLLGKKDSSVNKANKIAVHPVSHIKSRVTFTIMTDNIMLPVYSMPAELMNHIKYTNFIFICKQMTFENIYTYIMNVIHCLIYFLLQNNWQTDILAYCQL